MYHIVCCGWPVGLKGDDLLSYNLVSSISQTELHEVKTKSIWQLTPNKFFFFFFTVKEKKAHILAPVSRWMLVCPWAFILRCSRHPLIQVSPYTSNKVKKIFPKIIREKAALRNSSFRNLNLPLKAPHVTFVQNISSENFTFKIYIYIYWNGEYSHVLHISVKWNPFLCI